jgi:phage shock protein PspC (stress-responsive transcriptional regulator)
MNTVVTINLNGNAYQIDEGGYNVLKQYLASAETQLAGNPDRIEIMADLEQAIADKCQRYCGPHKTVVTAAEVQQIVQEMGPVEGTPGETRDNNAERETRAPNAPGGASQSRRRLYRILEGSMVTGVCEGIAAYLHVDPTLVRIVFVVLTILTYGTFAICYVILALVTPAAATPEELAAAHGSPFSAQNVIDEAKRTYEEFRNDKEWKRHWRKQKKEWRRLWRQGTGTSFPVRNLLLPVVAIIAIVAAVDLGRFRTPFPLHAPGFMELMMILIIVSMVTAPFRAARRAAYYSGADASPLTGVWIGVLWVFCAMVGGLFLYLAIPQVHYIVDNLPEILRGIFDR